MGPASALMCCSVVPPHFLVGGVIVCDCPRGVCECKGIGGVNSPDPTSASETPTIVSNFGTEGVGSMTLTQMPKNNVCVTTFLPHENVKKSVRAL